MTTRLGTRLGTSLGTSLGTGGVSALRTLYALTGFTASDFYGTTSGGGEAGDAAGFGGAVIPRLRSTGTSATRVLASRYATSPSNSGHYLYTQTTHTDVRLDVANGAGSWVSLSAPGPQRDRIAPLVYQHTGAGNTLQLWLSPDQRYTAAITGYAGGNPAVHYLGRATFASPATDTDIVQHITWRGVLSDAAVRALFATIRATGELPSSFAGVTVTHKWPDKALLKQLTAPATIPDVVTNASADAMAKTGSPTVTAIDLTRDGRRTLGSLGHSTANYWRATTKGIVGSTGGCTIVIPVRFDAFPTDGVGHFFVDATTIAPVRGYAISVYNGTLALYTAITAGSASNAATYVMPSSLLDGKGHLLVATYSGTTWRLFLDGVQVGSDAVRAYVPGDLMLLGYNLNGSLFGAAGSDTYGLTPAEVAQMQVDWDRTGKVVLPAGRATGAWDFTQDFAPTESVTATVQDRVGSDPLTRQGTLALAQRTERAWSYETSPIAYSVTGGIADYYTTASAPIYQGTTGASGAFFVTALIRIATQAVGSATRLFASSLQTPTTGGFYFQTLGTNSTLWFVPVSSAGSGTASPSFVISSSLVGKWIAVTGVFDAAGARIRQYVNRAEVGTGTAATGSSYNPSAGPLNVLRDPRGALGSDGIEVIGLTWGGFVPTLAEVQAQHDAIMAAEDIVAIPGKSQSLASFKRDKNNATVVDQLGGDHLSRVGTPALVSIYSRAFAW